MDLWASLEEKLDAAFAQALRILGDIAQSHGAGLYLVGGAVRDLLLGRDFNLDLDLMAQGDAIALATAAAAKLDAQLAAYPHFGTATLTLPNGARLDFARARTETYKKPGALPKVAPADSIEQDMARRDFTINAMALTLNADGRGRLIDPHNGHDDLRDGLLRALHPNSFIDDPTRILRGLRFQARFDFAFDYETETLLHRALSDEYLLRVSGARIRKEIQASLEEQCRVPIIIEWNRLNIDTGALAPGLSLHTAWLDPVDRAAAALTALTSGPRPLAPQAWIVYLLAAASGNSRETFADMAQRLSLTRKQAAPLFNPLTYSEQARAALDDPDLSQADAEELLAAAEDETLALLHATDDSGAIRAHVERFVNDSRAVRLEITGADLLAMGHEPSPAFARVLTEVRRQKIEGIITDRRQELRLARKLLDT